MSQAANIFDLTAADLMPNDLDKEQLDVLLQSEQIKIERIVSTGQSSPETGWYDQAQNEWVLVLAGEAILSFEETEDRHLSAGSYLNIPAHTRHRVKWTSPATATIWLAIHYPTDARIKHQH